MNQFYASSISFTPEERLKADFKLAKHLRLVAKIIHKVTGAESTLPFDYYQILDFDLSYSTAAIFLHDLSWALSAESASCADNTKVLCVSIHHMVDKIANGFTAEGDRENSRKLDIFSHAPHRLGFNKSVYIYAPFVISEREQMRAHFEANGMRARIRDIVYYEQQWEARRPDVFISHDSADKAAVAEPLYHALTAMGLKVWLDKYTLNLGDSLTEKINEGIAECRYGVLILSKAFLANERWAKRELNSFSVKDAIGDSHKLIPVWYGISEQDLAATGNYWLIDKLGGNTSDMEKLAEDIAKVVTKP